MDNLLIVGGTGVISYAVVQEAVKCGFSVTCINRGISKNQLLPNSVEVIKADYRNKSLIEEKLKTRFFDVIIDVLCFTEEDIEYSVSLFKEKCNQYVFFSSTAVYNKGKGDYECTEDSELINPIWKYSIRKVKCEKRLIELAALYSFNYTIVRPALTYGNTRIPYGITPSYGFHGTIIKRMLAHKPIILWDNGEVYSTITRVEDFAIGLIGLLGNKKAYNQAFHIAGDERYRWRDVIDTLGDVLGVKPLYFSVPKEILAKEMPHRSGEILGSRGINQLLDNSKLKSLVPNFKTSISLREGIKQTVDYYLSHNMLNGIDYSFDGNWDRIIHKHSKEKLYKVRFVDYMGNANFSDKVHYYIAFYHDRWDIQLIALSFRVMKKAGKVLFRK